jgi:hypothetical protein
MLFVEEYAQASAKALSEEGTPKFDTRFVAMGFEVDHEAVMKALREHLDELNGYGSIEVSNDHATINAAQAIGLQGFTEGFNSAIASLFAEHLLYRTLWEFYWKLPLGAPLYEEFGGIGRAVEMYYEMLTEGHVVTRLAVEGEDAA